MKDDCRFLLLVLAFSTILAFITIVQAQSSTGVLNIDCGKPANKTYENFEGINYTSDFQYIETGTIHEVLPEYQSLGYRQESHDLRSFPNGSRNCYTLKPVVEGGKYFVRAEFLYGNYDGQNQKSKFDLHLGVNFWTEVSITNASNYFAHEVMAVATMDFLSLCLVNTDQGTPFISAIEVRPLSNDFYQVLNSLQAFRTFYLGDTGGEKDYRYPNDVNDRIWRPFTLPEWRTISATTVTATESAYQPPSEVMRTASCPISASSMEFIWKSPTDARIPRPNKFFIALHFAELQLLNTSQSRIFDIYINGKQWRSNVNPLYLKTTTESSPRPESYDSIDVKIIQTGGSTLPPLINAIEVYKVLDFSGLETDRGDGMFLISGYSPTQLLRFDFFSRRWQFLFFSPEKICEFI